MGKIFNRDMALEFAKLSQSSYKDNAIGHKVGKWELVGRSIDILPDIKTGYYGEVYRHSETKKYVVVHRGTDGLGDLIANGKISLNVMPDQVKDGYRFLREFINLENRKNLDAILVESEFSQTGHSLGGLIAKLVGIASASREVYTFSAPGAEDMIDQLERFVERYFEEERGIFDFKKDKYEDGIFEYRLPDDLIAKDGDPSGKEIVLPYDTKVLIGAIALSKSLPILLGAGSGSWALSLGLDAAVVLDHHKLENLIKVLEGNRVDAGKFQFSNDVSGESVDYDGGTLTYGFSGFEDVSGGGSRLGVIVGAVKAAGVPVRETKLELDSGVGVEDMFGEGKAFVEGALLDVFDEFKSGVRIDDAFQQSFTLVQDGVERRIKVLERGAMALLPSGVVESIENLLDMGKRAVLEFQDYHFGKMEGWLQDQFGGIGDGWQDFEGENPNLARMTDEILKGLIEGDSLDEIIDGMLDIEGERLLQNYLNNNVGELLNLDAYFDTVEGQAMQHAITSFVTRLANYDGEITSDVIKEIGTDIATREFIQYQVLSRASWAGNGVGGFSAAGMGFVAGAVALAEGLFNDGRLTTEEIGYAAAVGIGAYVGALIGQVLIPIPYVGPLIGSIIGALVGQFFADAFGIGGDPPPPPVLVWEDQEDGSGRLYFVTEYSLTGESVLGRQDMEDDLIGHDRDDFLTGSNMDNILSGGDGDDVLEGRDGNDSLFGGQGDDVLDGGRGDDVLMGDGKDDSENVMRFGDDVLSGGDGNDTLSGGMGSDTLQGDRGNDVVMGDLGDDFLDGGYGDDTLIGGDGKDRIIAGSGNDHVMAGDGDDEVLGGDGDDTLFGDATDTNANGELIHVGDGADRLWGGVGNDVMNGGKGNDSLYGGAGDDMVHGFFGDDEIHGGRGNDTLLGDGISEYGEEIGGGNDVIYGGDGRDAIIAGAGDDVVHGGVGVDMIDAGHGDDTVYGGADKDAIDGGLGNDRLYGEGGDDEIRGGSGNDYINSGDGNNFVDGGLGDDVIRAGDGDDVILGGMGNDTVISGAGNNRFILGRGNDYVVLGSGDDTVEGNQGNDYINAGDGDDYVELGDGNDMVHGGGGDDRLFGGYGNDRIWTYQGNDYVEGGAGNDTLRSTYNHDTLLGGTGSDDYWVRLQRVKGHQADVIDIAGENDVLFLRDSRIRDVEFVVDGHDLVIRSRDELGMDNAVRIMGQFDPANQLSVNSNNIIGSGSELGMLSSYSAMNSELNEFGVRVIRSNAQHFETRADRVEKIVFSDGFEIGLNTFLLGTDGADEIYGTDIDESVDSGDGDDTVAGGKGNDSINGGDGNDVLFGGGGNDWIHGSRHDDYIHGGTGDDLLFDGLGNDIVYGGQGSDVIRITQEAGAEDVIRDFNLGEDTLDLSDFGDKFVDLFQLNAFYEGIRQDGDDTVIEIDGQVIRLAGVDSDELDASHFVFDLTIVDGQIGTDGNDYILPVLSFVGEFSPFARSQNRETQVSNAMYNMRDGKGFDLMVGIRSVFSAYKFALTQNPGDIDTIIGFSAIKDIIDLSGFDNIVDFLQIESKMVDAGKYGRHGVLSFRDGQKLVLKDFDVNELRAEDFLFQEAGVIPDVVRFYRSNNEIGYDFSQDDVVETRLSRGNRVDWESFSFHSPKTFDEDGSPYEFAPKRQDGFEIQTVETEGADTLMQNAEYRFFHFSHDKHRSHGVLKELPMFSSGAIQVYLDAGRFNSQAGLGRIGTYLRDFGTNDVLYGQHWGESIYGWGGHDKLFGGAGDDVLSGGDGNDILLGDDGNDTLLGEKGENLLIGGLGSDYLFSSALNNQDFRYIYYRGADHYRNFEYRNEIEFSPELDTQNVFAYQSLDESSSEHGVDTIYYFNSGVDLIDLSALGVRRSDIDINNIDLVVPIYSMHATEILIAGTSFKIVVVQRSGDRISLDDILVDEPSELLAQHLASSYQSLGEEIAYEDSDIFYFQGPTIFSEGADLVYENVHQAYKNVNNRWFPVGNDIRRVHFSVAQQSYGAYDSYKTRNVTNDYLIGKGWGEEIWGHGGHDWIEGNEGDDTLLGHDGNDLLDGGIGDDSILGGAGHDFMSGGLGSDSVSGSTGNDYLEGGLGSDFLVGGAGNDFIFGGDAASGSLFDDGDTIFGGLGHDRLFGMQGDDTIYGDDFNGVSGGNDSISGGIGDDSLVGGSGNDLIQGDGGRDRLFGESGNDWLYGGDGNDTIGGGAGHDYIEGGAGYDTINGGAGHDKILGGDERDEIQGGAGNDFIDGGESNDWLHGGAGADEIVDLDGDNELFGGSGADTIQAGDGSDYIHGGYGKDHLYGGGGNDIILNGDGGGWSFGGDGDDRLEGGILGDALRGGDGNDLILGKGGSDWLFGNDGNDVIYSGEGAHQYVYGGAGADRLFGGNGKDFFKGGTGDDVMRGAEGNNWFIGGGGRDISVGQSQNGVDTFVFTHLSDSTQNPDDMDVVFGFDIGKDKIELTGTGVSYDELAFDYDGGGVKMTHLESDFAVYFNGVDLQNPISESHFVFDSVTWNMPY